MNSNRSAVTLGDERERSVVNEAAAVSMTVGIYASLGAALLAAVLGSLTIPVILLVLAAAPTFTMMWWAKRHHVDMDELAAQAPTGYGRAVLVVVAVCLLLTLGAMAWTIFTGTGLVTIPDVQVAGPDATGPLHSFAKGAVLGGIGGVVLWTVLLLVGMARRRNAGS